MKKPNERALEFLDDQEEEDRHGASLSGYDASGVGQWTRRAARWPDGPKIMYRESTLRDMMTEQGG